ncbi:MAG: hypothetical protein QXD11_01535 [Candidatus Micrarchaeaceae archaeon]
MDARNKKVSKNKKPEPVFIVKAATKHGGLDYLHISLIILVIILIALTFALSFFKAPVILPSTNSSNASTFTNASINNATVISKAETILAGYSLVNTSLSLLPYYIITNSISAIPLVNGDWLVTAKFVSPLANNSVFNISLILYKNLSLKNSFMETIKPKIQSNTKVSAYGTIQINGRYNCNYTLPISVYLITDPYAPLALNSILNAINLSSNEANKISVSYYFVFAKYSMALYNKYGVYTTQLLGDYLACTSKQSNFKAFVENLSKIFTGVPVSQSMLNQLAIGSNIDMPELSSCISNASSLLNNQAILASFYNVTSTPIFIVNCHYISLPQTVASAINYSINQINK